MGRKRIQWEMENIGSKMAMRKQRFTHAGYGPTLENYPCGWEAIPKSALDIFSEPTGYCDAAGDDNSGHSFKLSLDR